MNQNSPGTAAVVGTNRLAGELLRLCRNLGFKATQTGEAEQVDPAASVAIETLAGTETDKRRAISILDEKLPASSVIVSSCLGFSATHIAAWAGRPERIVGFATFYPVEEKKIIELAAGLRSRDSCVDKAEDFFKMLDKDTVRVKDMPGLVFPRILSLIVNEAARSLDEGVAEAEEIDTALRLGTNYPLGPLRWADQAGLDEILAVLEGLQRETGDDRYRPTPLLKRMVRAGRLGESSGEGFYQYKGS